jgi:hypothetical protein
VHLQGEHWSLRVWPHPYVNIPYGQHRIIVLGQGHLTKRGRFYRWLPCCYRMKLRFCCGRS